MMKKLLLTFFLLIGFQQVNAISGGSYDSKSLTVLVQDTNIYALVFSDNGKRLYVGGNTNNAIYQYALSTAWDVSTGSYASKSCATNVEVNGDAHGIAFNSSGTKMYTADNVAVWQYSLSAAWDVSTCSYDSVTISTSAQDTSSRELFWKPGGTKLYIIGVQNDKIYQYGCSTPYSLSTCSYDSKATSVGTQDGLPAGGFWKSDGTKVYMIGGNRIFYRYGCTTAWDASSCTYDSDSLSATGEGAESDTGLEFNTDGTKMYKVGRLIGVVYQYSTAETWPAATAASVGLGFGGFF